MRRNSFVTLALASLVAAYSAAQAPSSSTHHSKTHHATVHHPRTHHPAPPPNPEAKEHMQTMKEETATQERTSHTSTEGKPSLRAEKSVSSAQRAASKHEARERRKHATKGRSVKKHPSTTHTVGENRLELERREAAESRSRYEEGFRAGFAAGLAARRSEAESTCATPPASHPVMRTLASRSSEPAPAAAPVAATHISDATVRSTTPVTGSAEPAGDVPASAPASAMERSHAGPEKASLEAAPGAHVVPLSLKASLHLLHEPVPAPMRGTLASLERQNQRLDSEGLQRVEDQSDLEYRIARKLLVPLPIAEGLTTNPALPVERRYCRPWTAEFLTDLARMHESVFHRPLRIDSAVRTVSYQRRLIAINANAAPAEGDIASPHETGAAVDIAKRGMTWREIGWMRRYLMTLQSAGLIDVEEEFYQSCFHITVYDTYGRHGLVRQAGTGNDGGTDRTSETATAAGDTQGQ